MSYSTAYGITLISSLSLITIIVVITDVYKRQPLNLGFGKMVLCSVCENFSGRHALVFRERHRVQVVNALRSVYLTSF